MSKCSVNDKTQSQILSLVLKTLMTSRKLSNLELKDSITNLFNTISDKYSITSSNVKTISGSIYNLCERAGVVDRIPELLRDPLSVANILLEIKEGTYKPNRQEISSEQLEDVEQVRVRADASRKFLDNAYGLATKVQEFVVNLTNQNLFDCFFINRGSIQGLRIGIVRNNSNLNDNIRHYLQSLLNKIVDYLNYVVEKSPDLKIAKTILNLLQDPQLYKQVGKNFRYTGILEKLSGIIGSYLSTDNFSSLSLIELYTIANDNSKSLTERDNAWRRLEAYNANIILTHFDTYLATTLGKSIKIKDFNVKTGKDKYQIAGTTANIATTWRVSENINVEDEADTVTKLAINTTPLYRNHQEEPIRGLYLTFADFSHIIAKIKDLAYREDAMNIVFDENFIRTYGYVWNSLSQNTKDFLKNKSLSTAINYIRRNPRQYLASIFEILTDSNFLDIYLTSLFKSSLFTKDELNKLYSLGKGIFNRTSSMSLYTLSDLNSDIDFYSFISLTADSIFKVNFILYYRDENGIMLIRTLIDLSVNNIKRGIELTINTNNSIKLIKDYDSYAQELLLKPISDKNGNLTGIEYVLPIGSKNIKVSVATSSGTVTFIDVMEGKSFNNFQKLWKDGEVKEYIDTVLRLGIASDVDLLNALLDEMKELNTLCKDLLSFAARVHLNLYVSAKIINGLSYSEIDSKIKEIYGNNPPSYNYQLSELGLIHGNDISLLTKIATAKANLNGITTAALAKDGEGNGQSLQSLSRLLGSLYSLWDLQERVNGKSNSIISATSDSILLTVPGLFEGHYTVKEFYDGDSAKNVTDMNVSEMLYSNIVYDFIGGLLPSSKNEINPVVRDGHVLFLPSVNSDKSTIGRIKINLNKEVTINGLIKAIKNLNSEELEQLIASELGHTYEIMYLNVTDDWNKLDLFIRTKIPNVPSLSSDFLHNFDTFNTWLENNRHILARYGKTPVDFIKSMVREYNKTNRLNPLELIDLVHFKNIGGELKVNQVFISQIARYNPNFLLGIDANFDLSKYPTSKQFWGLKKIEFLKGLLKSNFRINVTDASQRELKEGIVNKYPQWINESGDVILAKVNFNGQTINITANRDLRILLEQLKAKTINETIDIINFNNLLLNPILEQYNYLEYLFTQEFMNATVGSFIAHPEKSGSDDVLQQEAACFLALHKRNVSFTAAMHAFQLNLLNGIPEHYNIAVIEDIKDELGVIIGLNESIKPFDGATFVNPFVVYLENYSLGGAKAGITKKQFVHFKNERTGTSGIIKTAGFGLTNDWIRNSPFLGTMMRKMTNHIWLDKFGNPATVDFTQSYKGNKTIFNDIYFKDSNKFFKVTSIESHGNNTYSRTIVEVDINGTPIESPYTEAEKIINNNYDLWNYFGGKNSMVMGDDNKLKLSNTSVENVVLAMNNAKCVEDNPSYIETQDLLWQPLKHSDVHYVATAGAVKQGGANINSMDRYSDDIPYDILRIKMYQAGIQLDKEHHADDSELSLMTLVISACASLGYTFEAASKIYNALRVTTENGTAEHISALNEAFKGKSYVLHEVLTDSIIKALGKSSKKGGNFVEIIASDLIDRARLGEKINFSETLLPLSDNTIYAKVVSIISSYLTNTGIKLKIPGILSVLTPSYNIFKLYADRKYESFTNPVEELQELLNQQIPISNISNLELGRNYFVKRLVFADPIDFTTPNNEGISLESAYRNIIYNRIYNSDFVTPLIKSLITKIRNNNSSASLLDVVNKILDAVPEHVDKQILKLNLLKLINAPISDNLYEVPGQDITTELNYLKEVLGKYTSNENLKSIVLGNKDILKESLKRYNLEEFTDNIIAGATEYANTNNIILTAEFTNDSELIRTPSEYRKLKLDIAKGDVIEVIEDVTKGRDLAAYNVRFLTTEGEYFQLWDLDSAANLFDYNEIVKSYNKKFKSVKNKAEQIVLEHAKKLELTQLFLKAFPNLAVDLNNLEVLLRRTLLKDLLNLSPSTPALNAQYKELLDSNDGTYDWYNRYAQWINIYLGTGNGNLLEYTAKDPNTNELISVKTTVNANNFEQLEPYFRQILANTTKVKIGGKLVSVDKNTIKVQPYELIMPKIFATAFGLKEFDDLNTIVNDEYFFVKQYLNNQATKIEDKLFDIELKNSTGNHYYLLTKRSAVDSGLKKLQNIITSYIDGKLYRLDSNGEVMYEITEDTEIYFDESTNTEVIVTDDLNFYIENLNFDSIKLSPIIKPSLATNFVESFKHSKNRKIRRFVQYLTGYGNYYKSIMDQNQRFHSTVTLDNYMTVSPTDPIIRMGKEKHTSFIKSLDVVAARTPSQSMQSFMPMRVVAFDNPDINTAHVSTMLLLLQGSDYDVDAVSLSTYDIDDNGMLKLWSPFANIQNLELYEASVKLPFPTGIETNFETVDNLTEAGKFISKYSGLFNISRGQTFNNQTKEWDFSSSEVNVDLNLDTPEKINLFGQFLNEAQFLRVPTQQFYESFIQVLNKYGITNNLTGNYVPSIFEKIKLIVDNHNLYFDSFKSKRNITQIVNNYLFYLMFSVSGTPANLIEAQTSVDSTTGPLKAEGENSPDAKELTNRTPGNAVNKFESIEDNQVGKKGIGICAVGLKTFFGLTQYCNYVLNYGTSEEQKRLLIGPKHAGITINGKTYKTLNNIRSNNINSILNKNLMSALANTKNDTDSALILSALLSLTTDNAKELALSKLNASIKTLGIYVYGVCIGMDFKDISKIMMSDVGRIINDVANGNVFTNKYEYRNIDENLFKYFDEGPFVILKEFDISKDSNGQVINSPYKLLSNMFEVKVKEIIPRDEKNYPHGQFNFPQVLSNFAKNQMSLSGKLKIFEDLRNKYIGSFEGKLKYNLLIDFILNYIYLCHIISQNTNDYDAIKTMSKGALELKILGRLFSLNLGLKTNPSELTTLINYLERAIYEKTGREEDIIDLTRFVLDEKYRLNCILSYESVKHSFNILDAISKVPHFMGYVQTLATASKELESSFKFRSTKNLLLDVNKILKFKLEDKVAKGILNYIGDYMRRKWMIDSEKIVIIPKGNTAFSPSGTPFELEEDTPIRLGTHHGDATFRLWMENLVIPDLKKGNIKPKVKSTSVSDNKFIKDLGNDLITTTISHNPTIIYTLPINMLPRSDRERSIFNDYKAEFNKLSSKAYEYKVSGQRELESVPIVDLFTYYAMIANNWKLGEKSLVPILENFLNTGIIKEFHDFEASLDKSGNTLSLEDIWYDDIKPYVAPFENPYNSKVTTIWHRDPESKKYKMMSLSVSTNDDLYIEDPSGGLFKDTSRIGKYEFEGSYSDFNYFQTGILEKNSFIKKFSFYDDKFSYNITLEYNKESYNIDHLKVTTYEKDTENIEIYELKNFKELTPEIIQKYCVVKRNGIKDIDTSRLAGFIKNEINKCN